MAADRVIVLASRNRDKIREMNQVCSGLPLRVTSALDHPGLPEVIEDGTTIEGNATRKAIVTAAYTGEIAVADDTAFRVDALGGLPDIFASRLAGPGATYADNARLAVELCAGVPDGSRGARFETAMVWVDPRPLASVEAGCGVPRPADSRWLHNPFARSVQVADPQREDDFWNDLLDRRSIWSAYHTAMTTLHLEMGPGRERLRALADELMGSFLAGGRPTDAPADHMRLPDTRIWTCPPPRLDELPRPRTVIAPAGLPADAPGRSMSEDVWLEIRTEGRLLGELTRQPIGIGGFGYDPVFRPADDHRTLAEYSAAEKNAVSHRGRALRRLLRTVGEVYGKRAEI